MTRRTSGRVAAVALTAASGMIAGALTASAAPPGGEPTPGAAGIGDRLYPTLGNGGYDALHYGLDLRYATSAPTQGVEGTLTLRARATQALSRFNLDFAGKGVAGVEVDARAATFTRTGEELVVTPKAPIRKGTTFTVTVQGFTADPTVPTSEDFLSAAFFTTPDGSATAGQPNGMHVMYPSNDHPRDKASFSFRVDVPEGTTAVANGVQTGKRTAGGRTVWSYEQRQPMATELTQIAVGAFTVVPRGRVDGVVVRDVVPTRLKAEYDARLPVEKEQLPWMRQRAGRYPFDTYGSLVVDADLGFALETQTLSLYDTAWFTEYERGVWEPTMLHELAHQWFGNSVSPTDWSDLWQNEGHATWYEWVYAAERGQLEADTGYADFQQLMHRVYELNDRWRAQYGPTGRPLSGDPDELFNINVYYGGALVLYALRQQVGEEKFAAIERAWVTKYAGRSASTADFIALASKVSGKDLTAFLKAWLYDARTPPMPGHPDWTTLPVSAAPAAAAKSPAFGGTALEALRRH